MAIWLRRFERPTISPISTDISCVMARKVSHRALTCAKCPIQ
jgi:hypothetical protein